MYEMHLDRLLLERSADIGCLRKNLPPSANLFRMPRSVVEPNVHYQTSTTRTLWFLGPQNFVKSRKQRSVSKWSGTIRASGLHRGGRSLAYWQYEGKTIVFTGLPSLRTIKCRWSDGSRVMLLITHHSRQLPRAYLTQPCTPVFPTLVTLITFRMFTKDRQHQQERMNNFFKEGYHNTTESATGGGFNTPEVDRNTGWFWMTNVGRNWLILSNK